MAKGSMMVWSPSRRWLGWLALTGALLGGTLTAQARQFSADLVLTARNDGVTTPVGTLRVLGEKTRIETPDLAGSFFLTDGAKPAAYFVRPAARVFMDARKSSQLTRLFVPVDPDNPCAQWQTMAKLAGVADQVDWRCERVGEQTIGAQNTVGYRAISARGQEFTGWIDLARKFPIRIETAEGTVISAKEIRDEAQPPEPFEIPAGFRKFVPEMLIEQIKQSDVWVESPSAKP